MKYWIIGVFSLAMLFSAQGELHSFSFSGQIQTIIQNENFTLRNLGIGDPFSGSFTYSDVPDSNSTVGLGGYNQQATLSLTLGDNQIDYDGYVYIRVWDNLVGKDGFDFAEDNTFGDWSMWWFGFDLADSTQTAYNDDSLPSSFDVSGFDNPAFRLGGSRLSTGEQFEVELEVQDISPIPEPSTLSLLGIASAFIWQVRKQRVLR